MPTTCSTTRGYLVPSDDQVNSFVTQFMSDLKDPAVAPKIRLNLEGYFTDHGVSPDSAREILQNFDGGKDIAAIMFCKNTCGCTVCCTYSAVLLLTIVFL